MRISLDGSRLLLDDSIPLIALGTTPLPTRGLCPTSSTDKNTSLFSSQGLLCHKKLNHLCLPKYKKTTAKTDRPGLGKATNARPTSPRKATNAQPTSPRHQHQALGP